MASGDTIFVLSALGASPPAANGAAFGVIADLSTPGMQVPVWKFDGSADEHMDWFVTLPSHYGETTGLTFSYKYAMSAVDADIVEIEFRVLHLDDLDDLDTDLLMDGQTAVAIQDTPNGTANALMYTTTGALAKANFGSAAPGDLLAIRATRDVSAATNTDDLQLVEILVTET